jgi:hypothetical protein
MLHSYHFGPLGYGLEFRFSASGSELSLSHIVPDHAISA